MWPDVVVVPPLFECVLQLRKATVHKDFRPGVFLLAQRWTLRSKYSRLSDMSVQVTCGKCCLATNLVLFWFCYCAKVSSVAEYQHSNRCRNKQRNHVNCFVAILIIVDDFSFSEQLQQQLFVAHRVLLVCQSD